MYFLIYVSSASTLFSSGQLRDLLATCVRNNRRDGITGMLVYKDGNFMQVLEGLETTVQAVHLRISRDVRHNGLITLLQGAQSSRQFPEWSMGFRDLELAGDQPAGYSEFLNTSLTGKEFSDDPSRAQKLLLTFKQNM